VWVGIGCGLLALLTFGGCIAVGVFVGRQAAEEQRRPVTEQQIKEDLKQAPVYPGARVDVEASKQLRVGSSVVSRMSLGKFDVGTGVFRVPAPPDKVIDWYDAKLTGWRRVNTRERRNLGGRDIAVTDTRQYLRGDKQLLVQVGQKSGERKTSHLVLMLISGIPQNQNQ
jgi:hypothetical protein